MTYGYVVRVVRRDSGRIVTSSGTIASPLVDAGIARGLAREWKREYKQAGCRVERVKITVTVTEV